MARKRALVLGVLLEEVLSWVRTLPGSQRLRALVVFDEVYGFLPPHPAKPALIIIICATTAFLISLQVLVVWKLAVGLCSGRATAVTTAYCPDPSPQSPDPAHGDERAKRALASQHASC